MAAGEDCAAVGQQHGTLLKCGAERYPLRFPLHTPAVLRQRYSPQIRNALREPAEVSWQTPLSQRIEEPRRPTRPGPSDQMLARRSAAVQPVSRAAPPLTGTRKRSRGRRWRRHRPVEPAAVDKQFISIGRPHGPLGIREIGTHADSFPARRWDDERLAFKMVRFAGPVRDPFTVRREFRRSSQRRDQALQPACDWDHVRAASVSLRPERNLGGIGREVWRRVHALIAGEAPRFAGIERTHPDIDVAGLVAGVGQHSPVARNTRVE